MPAKKKVEAVEATAEARPFRKAREGIVVSTKMEKTVVVLIEDRRQHPLYRRTLRRTQRWQCHNDDNAARLGDLVRIEESSPISKHKHWRVIEILERGDVAELQPTEIGVPVVEHAEQEEAS